MNYVGQINYTQLGKLIGVEKAIYKKNRLTDVCIELLSLADKITDEIKATGLEHRPKIADRPENTEVHDAYKVYSFRYLSKQAGRKISSITPCKVLPRHMIVFNKYESELLRILEKYNQKSK